MESLRDPSEAGMEHLSAKGGLVTTARLENSGRPGAELLAQRESRPITCLWPEGRTIPWRVPPLRRSVFVPITCPTILATVGVQGHVRACGTGPSWLESWAVVSELALIWLDPSTKSLSVSGNEGCDICAWLVCQQGGWKDCPLLGCHGLSPLTALYSWVF